MASVSYTHLDVYKRQALDSAVFANAAAAISVTGHGGRAALPDLAACQAKLADVKAPKPVQLAVV